MITQPLKHAPYSPSRIEASQCSYHFGRKYISKDAPKEDSEAASKGSAVHHAFEMIVNAIIAKEPLPTKDMCIVSALQKYPLREKSSFDFLNEAVTLFLENPTRMFNPALVVGVEELLAVDANYQPIDYEDPKAFLRGKADILIIEGDTATIIDHKNQLNVEDADTFQMGVYALLVLCTYPYINKVQSILHFSAPDLNFYSKPAIWSREHIEDFKIFVESRIMRAEDIDPANTTAIPGKYCQYCSMLTACPEKAVIESDYFRKVGPIDSAQTAADYARAYVYLDESMDALKKNLHTYVSAIGPVPCGNTIVEIREQGSRGYDKKAAVLEVLKAHKIDSEPYLKVDGGMLKKLIESRETPPKLVADLERVTYKKPVLKMAAYKVK